MPRHQKGKRGPDVFQDLKSAPLTQSKAESVKGGSQEEIGLQSQMERGQKVSTTLSTMMKKMSDTSSSIIGNLK